MGREAMVTVEQVAAAADAMKAAGIKPTSRAVRERLGNVGSLGTINKMLQQWKAGQKYQVGAEAPVVLPLALQRAFLAHMDQEIAAARAGIEADLADQQQETADLATENERQLATIGELMLQLDARAAEKASADGRSRQLEADLETARADVAREREAAEHARTECAKVLLRQEALPRLESDLNAARNELQQEHQARINAEQAAAVLTAQKTDLDSRLAEATERIRRLEHHSADMQEKAEVLAAQLADARVAVETAQTRIALLGQEAADAKRDANKARAEAKSAGLEAAERRSRLAPQRPSAS
jgi:chromosome segregation ATPase